ncbi:MAG: hypothetical protein ABFS09_06220 [Thermodesulfobacteriota bacterium]
MRKVHGFLGGFVIFFENLSKAGDISLSITYFSSSINIIEVCRGNF